MACCPVLNEYSDRAKAIKARRLSSRHKATVGNVSKHELYTYTRWVAFRQLDSTSTSSSETNSQRKLGPHPMYIRSSLSRYLDHPSSIRETDHQAGGRTFVISNPDPDSEDGDIVLPFSSIPERLHHSSLSTTFARTGTLSHPITSYHSTVCLPLRRCFHQSTHCYFLAVFCKRVSFTKLLRPWSPGRSISR
jgi:hypothetical protein